MESCNCRLKQSDQLVDTGVHGCFSWASIACFHLVAVTSQQGITALTHAVVAAGGQPGTVSSLEPKSVLCKADVVPFMFLFILGVS